MDRCATQDKQFAGASSILVTLQNPASKQHRASGPFFHRAAPVASLYFDAEKIGGGGFFG
jgi:hypothetical protein